MSTRKYNFKNLTPAQLDTIAAKRPEAMVTVTKRKVNYAVLAMLFNCGVEFEGVTVDDVVMKPAFLRNHGTAK